MATFKREKLAVSEAVTVVVEMAAVVVVVVEMAAVVVVVVAWVEWPSHPRPLAHQS